MRRFLLRRIEDVSGISGLGIVAEGVQFSSGWCVLAWVTDHRSIAFYESLDELMAIHGHNGATVTEWIDG